MGHIAHRGNLGAVLLPKEIFRDPRLTGNERLLLCTLFEWTNNETGWCNPSLVSIGEASGIKPKNQGIVTAGLVEKGWLTLKSGNTHETNEYTVHVPEESTEWSYTVITDKKLSKEDWAKKQKANAAKKSADMSAAKVKRNEWWAMGPEEILAELQAEQKAGSTWVPQEYLDNFGMVRGADNSQDACELRRERQAGRKPVQSAGVIDRFELDGIDAAPTREELAMLQRDLAEM